MAVAFVAPPFQDRNDLFLEEFELLGVGFVGRVRSVCDIRVEVLCQADSAGKNHGCQ